MKINNSNSNKMVCFSLFLLLFTSTISRGPRHVSRFDSAEIVWFGSHYTVLLAKTTFSSLPYQFS
jgi:hypothetical protein